MSDHIQQNVRVVLINPDNAILLVKLHFPADYYDINDRDDGPFWLTIGGGIKEGENFEDAARREVYEESGITDIIFLSGPIWIRDKIEIQTPKGVKTYQDNFLVAKTTAKDIKPTALDDIESSIIKDISWWNVDDIQSTQEKILPKQLGLLLPDILEGCYPENTVSID